MKILLLILAISCFSNPKVEFLEKKLDGIAYNIQPNDRFMEHFIVVDWKGWVWYVQVLLMEDGYEILRKSRLFKIPKK